MSLSKMTGAAVLLALAPSVMAMGSATVVNNCGFPIYYAAVGQSQAAGMQQMQGSYSQQFSQPGNGYSIKLATSPSGDVTQFEFTLGSDGKINYDLSNINGNPFAAGGMLVEPSMSGDSSNPSCVPISCPAGASTCTAAYNQPDDVRTHVCSDQADLVLTMCPGGSPSGGSGASAPSSSQPAASSTTTWAAPASSSTSSSSAAASPTQTQGSYNNGGWGKPPAKRAEHGHQRMHSRAFIV